MARIVRKFNPRLQYRAKEAASYLGINYATLKNWLKDGKVPSAFKTGGGKGVWAIPKLALDDLAKSHHAEYKLHYLGKKYPHQDLILWFMIKHRFKYMPVRINIEKYGLQMIDLTDFEVFKKYTVARINLVNENLAKSIKVDYGPALHLNSKDIMSACDDLDVGELYDDDDIVPWRLFGRPFVRWDVDCLCSRGMSDEQIRNFIIEKHDMELQIDEISYWRKFIFNWGTLTESQKKEYIIDLPMDESHYKMELIFCSPSMFRVKMGLQTEEEQMDHAKFIIHSAMDELHARMLMSGKGNMDPSAFKSFADSVFKGQDRIDKLKSGGDAIKDIVDSYKNVDPSHEVEADVDAINIDQLEGNIMSSKPKADKESEDESNASAG